MNNLKDIGDLVLTMGVSLTLVTAAYCALENMSEWLISRCNTWQDEEKNPRYQRKTDALEGMPRPVPAPQDVRRQTYAGHGGHGWGPMFLY